MIKWKRYLAVAAVFLLLVIVQVRNPEINGPFKGIFGNIVNPFIYLATKTTDAVGGVWNGYVNLIGVKKDNRELKRTISELRLENELLLERMNEFDRLKKLLNFREQSTLETIACNVVGRNVEGFLKYVIIDRGSFDDVRVNDTVISFSGLVGHVSEVYLNTARVEVILNLNSNVSVINRRTRAVGILRGDGLGKTQIDYYDRLDTVETGDVIITSGLGGLYPKGIPVGTVSEVNRQQTGLFQDVKVDQAVDFYKLENVLIVRQEQDEK